MKLRNIAAALVSLVALIGGYYFYLQTVHARKNCESGNYYLCAEELARLRVIPEYKVLYQTNIETHCPIDGPGFCAEAMTDLTAERERFNQISKLQEKLKCGIQIPLSLWREACVGESITGKRNIIDEKIARQIQDLDSACRLPPALPSACESAIGFIQTHPELQDHLMALLHQACEVGWTAYCEASIQKSLEKEDLDLAAEEYLNWFRGQQVSIYGPLDQCPTNEKFWGIAQKRAAEFDLELKKQPVDAVKLADLAAQAFALNCRDQGTRLRLAISHAIHRDFAAARAVLEKVPNGRNEFLKNDGLENLRSDCLQRQQLDDKWCVAYLRSKLNYLDPAEVQKLLQPQIKDIEKLINASNVQKFLNWVHTEKGLRVWQDESGDINFDTHFQVKDLLDKGPQQDKLHGWLQEAKEYLKKGKVEYIDLLETTEQHLRVSFVIYEGHHAGNMRSFALEFSPEGKSWRCVGLAFISDFSP